ncbi:MAG: Holliday junction branch migration DNA helicase RuvB, partial [Nitrospinota bacterium]|nr:Holliday junction branch migration DNA helicase RuvB [Nitrospinota bacterium]
YTVDELATIIKRSSKILKTSIDQSGAREIASRSRGTPRVANRLLRRIRDFAEVRADGMINIQVADEALQMLEVDQQGFDKMDRKLLLTLIDDFGGGPAGIESLAAAIGEDKDTIEDVFEPFLIQEGFIQRTSRGRIATERAYNHFGRSLKGRVPGTLDLPFANGKG